MGLRARADEIWRRAFELLQRESSEYHNAIDDEFTEESKVHCQELLTMIVAIGAGEVRRTAANPFDFVCAHARWRARHHVPLVASLHAYRIAHRIYSEISQDALSKHPTDMEIVEALRLLSQFWLEFFDHVGQLLADAHAAEDALAAALETPSYPRLMDDLLKGIEPATTELRRLCDLRGIRPGAPLAVAVGRPRRANNHRADDGEVALRSLTRLIEQTLSPSVFGTLLDARDGQITAIVCSAANPAHNLVQALRRGGFAKRVANRQSAGVGVSTDVAEVSVLPEALKEALVALEFTSDQQPLMHFAEIHLPDLLIRRSDPMAVRLIPAWARQLHSADDPQSRELIRTIRVFSNCSFNVKSTAQALGVHTNTVYFRLVRLRKLSGIDPRTYSGATLILTALRLLEYHANVS